jgi:hypothetical protein
LLRNRKPIYKKHQPRQFSKAHVLQNFIVMANGYCPALLAHIDSIAGCNSPGKRLSPVGFTQMLLQFQNSLVNPINNVSDNNTGHVRTMTVKYRKRPLVSDVKDTEDCEVDAVPAWLEWNVPGWLYREYSWFLSDEEIQKYCNEASNTVTRGRPATPFMQEHFDFFVTAANAILHSINIALVTEMATKFGENIVTGSSDGTVINIPQTPSMVLDDGLIRLLQDLRENGICEDVAIVGAGLYSAWDMARIAACCNSAGFDLSRFSVPRFYFDKDTQPIWGQNSIGVFSQCSAKLLSRNRYVGAFAGHKGNSFFFTMPLPVDQYCCLESNMSDLIFDVQMRYFDCPTTIDINGVPTEVGRGWQVIVSKYFNLWVTPDDGLDPADEYFGVNGTLKYFVMNEPTSGGGYGY